MTQGPWTPREENLAGPGAEPIVDADSHFQNNTITQAIRRTRRSMTLERLVRAFWPAAALIATLWSVLAFGVAESLARSELLGLLGFGLVGLALLLWRGFRGFRWPTADEAQARVDETLPGRPLHGLADRPSLGVHDPGARAVWALHRSRLQRIAALARPVRADLRLAAWDPWALRLVALVALGTALIFARGGIESTVRTLASPPPAAVAAGPSYEGWAEPPDYTGRPAVYLPEVAAGTALSLPEGTRITLRVYGAIDGFQMTEGVSGAPTALAEAAPGIGSASFELQRDGSVVLERSGRPLASWQFTAEPDLPPTIALAGPVEFGAGGEMRMPYVASDDHGVTAARVEISLDPARADRRYGLAVDPEPRPPLVVNLPLAMTGSGAEVEETLVENFSQHPFANLPVRLRLVAEDARGQTGEARDLPALLPGKRFYDPVAAALIEQRRDLLWSTANAERVTQVLQAITWRPEGIFDSQRAYLLVRAAVSQLADARRSGSVADARDAVAEGLWMAALLLEEGGLGDAAERLAKAKERLQEALRNGASDDEIARLMDELRQATDDYMRQLAEEAIERGDNQQAEAAPEGQSMTQDQLQQLMDRIQELSEQGRKAEAEAMLEMLQQMLENMEMRMTQGGQPGEGQQGQGQQAMRGLSDTLREQQGLADESFQQLQREFREGRGQPGQSGQGGGEQGQQNEGQPESGNDSTGSEQAGENGQAPSREDLARRQEALRDLLEGLREGLPGGTGESVEQALREAERNMEEAGRGLDRGDTSEALDRQSEAIDRLRDGMRELGEDMRRAEGQGSPMSGEGEGTPRSETDPLGRPLGARGTMGTDEQMVPGADAAARARQLLDEIRRRSGELSRPEIELDYLRRLLDRF